MKVNIYRNENGNRYEKIGHSLISHPLLAAAVV